MNEMSKDIVLQSLAALSKRVETLEAEADIRRVQAQYMFLCDTPCPEAGVENDAERIERILELYTEDAVWEGVGAYYDNQFGRRVGKAALREHFEAFWEARSGLAAQRALPDLGADPCARRRGRRAMGALPAVDFLRRIVVVAVQSFEQSVPQGRWPLESRSHANGKCVRGAASRRMGEQHPGTFGVDALMRK
jgi:hypothetical protein